MRLVRGLENLGQTALDCGSVYFLKVGVELSYQVVYRAVLGAML